MKLPWKTKGIVLTAPLRECVDDTVKFIDEYLAPNGCNLICMQIRYRYQFKRHPECMGYDPLSEEDIKKIVRVCKKHGIRLLPKMNLHGHQSGLPNTPTDGILHGHHECIPDIRDGLLRAYPEFDEQASEPGSYYSRSLCLTNPLVKIILFDLIDELLEVFEADGMHIGCDEVLNIGLCPECRKYSNAKLFGDWVTAIHDHLASRGAQMLIWGDRFLNSAETGYQEYESSANGTDPAIDVVAKDILICDWHYEKQTEYPSLEIYKKKGFKMVISPWRIREHTDNFIRYAIAHDEGQVEGILLTTWCGSGDLARHMLYEEPGRWEHTEEIARNIRHIFEEQ